MWSCRAERCGRGGDAWGGIGHRVRAAHAGAPVAPATGPHLLAPAEPDDADPDGHEQQADEQAGATTGRAVPGEGIEPAEGPPPRERDQPHETTDEQAEAEPAGGVGRRGDEDPAGAGVLPGHDQPQHQVGEDAEAAEPGGHEGQPDKGQVDAGGLGEAAAHAAQHAVARSQRPPRGRLGRGQPGSGSGTGEGRSRKGTLGLGGTVIAAVGGELGRHGSRIDEGRTAAIRDLPEPTLRWPRAGVGGPPDAPLAGSVRTSTWPCPSP